MKKLFASILVLIMALPLYSAEKKNKRTHAKKSAHSVSAKRSAKSSRSVSEKSDSKEGNQSDIRIYNFGENMPQEGWAGIVKGDSIQKWADRNQMIPVGDKAPLFDNVAGFVSKHGSRIVAENLSRYKHYYLWVDFVTFKQKKKKNVPSRLRISCDGRKLIEVVFCQFKPEDMYKIELPSDLTFDGRAEITFEEISHTKGLWGIWDMIISAEPLPAKIEIAKPEPKKVEPAIVEPEQRIERGSAPQKSAPKSVIRRNVSPLPDRKDSTIDVRPSLPDDKRQDKKVNESEKSEPEAEKKETPEESEQKLKESREAAKATMKLMLDNVLGAPSKKEEQKEASKKKGFSEPTVAEPEAPKEPDFLE